MRITMTDLVKHDGRTYHKGDTLTVDDEIGKYFRACGWASTAGDPPIAPEPGHVELEVQSAKHLSRTEIK